MGTALTEEQVAELARMVPCSSCASTPTAPGRRRCCGPRGSPPARKLELRVVALPEGTDPAELVEREGAEALRARVEGSVPFVVFRVERILARGRHAQRRGSRAGAGRSSRRCSTELPGSVLREELVRRVSGRLELNEGQLRRRCCRAQRGGVADRRGRRRAARSSAGAGPRRRPRRPAPSGSSSRSASPCPTRGRGARADRRRSAADQPSRCGGPRGIWPSAPGTPLADLPAEDEEFARADRPPGRARRPAPDPSPERLEHARLVLERDRLDRAIIRARGARRRAPTSWPASARPCATPIRAVVGRLEKTL